jgi:hypothetical protein
VEKVESIACMNKAGKIAREASRIQLEQIRPLLESACRLWRHRTPLERRGQCGEGAATALLPLSASQPTATAEHKAHFYIKLVAFLRCPGERL